MPTVIQCNLPYGSSDESLDTALAQALETHTQFPLLSNALDYSLLTLAGLPDVEIEINGIAMPCSAQMQYKLEMLNKKLCAIYPNKPPQIFINRNSPSNQVAAGAQAREDEHAFNTFLQQAQIANDLEPAEYVKQLYEAIKLSDKKSAKKFAPYLVKHFYEKGKQLSTFEAGIFYLAAVNICKHYMTQQPTWAVNESIISESMVSLLFNHGQYAYALKRLEHTRQNLTLWYTDESFRIADMDILMAKQLAALKRFDEACVKYEQGCNKIESGYDTTHPKLISAVGAYAMLHIELAMSHEKDNHFEKALSEYNLALTLYKRHPNNHRQDQAFVLHYMAALLTKYKHYDAALEYYEETVTVLKAALGPKSIALAKIYIERALIYKEQGEGDSALAQLIYAHIMMHHIDPQHLVMAKIYHHLGEIYCENGEYSTANKYLSLALSIRTTQLGADHPYTLITQYALDFNSTHSYSIDNFSDFGTVRGPDWYDGDRSTLRTITDNAYADCDSMDAFEYKY